MVLGAEGTLYVANGIVSTAMPAQQSPVIDWSGTLGLPGTAPLPGRSSASSNWLEDFLGTGPDDLDLTLKTGLKVHIRQ